MRRRFKLAAVVLALALLAQPLAVAAECVAMPAKACSSPAERSMRDMHCRPASQLEAQEKSACCEVQSAPAAPSKAPAAATQLVAAAVPVKEPLPAAAPVLALAAWTYHGPPLLQGTSQTQALLCVFLI